MAAQPRQATSERVAATCGRARSLEEGFRALVARQGWLEPASDKVSRAVGRALRATGPGVEDFLHGTWLRHPLHPALTDLPIGAWLVATALDAAELGSARPKLARWTDTAIGIGIAGGVAAAVSGFTDWRQINGFPKRVGLVHAALNAAALTLFGASLGLRLNGARRTGIILSTLGTISVAFSGWIGGHLIYAEGIGVDHNVFQEGPDDFVPVMREGDLPEGRLTKARANGASVLLFRRNGRLSAIGETCAHLGGPLSRGRLEEGDVVKCPWHGSRYRLEDGELVGGPSAFDQPCFEVRARDGQIEVRRSRPPR